MLNKFAYMYMSYPDFCLFAHWFCTPHDGMFRWKWLVWILSYNINCDSCPGNVLVQEHTMYELDIPVQERAKSDSNILFQECAKCDLHIPVQEHAKCNSDKYIT